MKADAAVSAGLDCVALLGVWSWRGTNESNGTTALPDFEYIALKGRRVVTGTAFDSDVMLKTSVHQALTRFGAYLNHRGVDVAYAYLPHGEAGTKVGLDDWLAAGHAGTEFFDISSPKLRTPDRDLASEGRAAACSRSRSGRRSRAS